jgi:outer membrane receptor protein involved in Fe transport
MGCGIFSLRRVVLGGVALSALLAGAANAESRRFDIPAQPAATGITQFARQAGVQILVKADITTGQHTAAVRGALPLDQALSRLLEGAGLVVVANDGRTITLGRARANLFKVSYVAAPPASLAPAAEPTAEAAPANTQVEAVVVTGTRLTTAGFTAPTPVTVIGSAEVQAKGGATIAEFVKDMPAFRTPVGQSQNSNGAQSAGKATLALRGLGASRTLTLVNGRRHVPDGTGNVFDSNLIPTSMIDRVDVVTGGASAAYGSDAVAGAVNLVLKNRYDGVSIDLRYGVSQRGDAVEINPSFIAGGSWFNDRLHLVVGGDYVDSKGTGTMYVRDWGKKEPGLMTIAASAIPNRVALGLPANIISNYVETSAYNDQGMITSGPLRGTVFHDGGLTSLFNYGTINGGTEMINPAQTNYGSVENPDGFLRAPYKRQAYMARGEFDFTSDIVGFAQLQFAEFLPRGRSFGARIPNFSNYPVLITNPFLPASVVAAMRANNITQFNYSATRHEDLGSIKSRNRTDTLQADFGLRGKVFTDWDWDIGVGVGRANFVPKLIDTPRTADFFASAYVVAGPNGQPVCGPVATNPYFNAQNAITKALLISNLSPGCVPFNIFGSNVAYNEAAKRYYNSASNADFEFNQYDVAINLAGSPYTLPAGPLALAVGAEWRKDTLSSLNSVDGQRGALMNQNYSLFSGEVTVKEAYAEVGAPVFADLPFVQALDLNGAVRRTDYSTSGSVTTWKVGFTWDVNTMFRMRATRSHDIRAPNINELYNPGSEGNPNVVNRLNGASGFIKSNTVGNINLNPEIGDTTTAGFVFQPHWAWTEGFRLAVDWYDIELKGAIATLSAQEILDDLLLRGNTSYEQYVVRDGTALGFARVNATQLNLNAQRTNGVDIEIAYNVPLSALPIAVPGSLNLRAIGSWTDDARSITASGVDTDVAGTITNPEWSWNVTGSYVLDRLSANIQVRYVNEMKYSATLVGPENPNYSVALSSSINRNLWPSALLFYAGGSYVVKQEGDRKIQVYGNIDNLLDKTPPIVAITSQGPYDLIGRAFKLGVRFTY